MPKIRTTKPPIIKSEMKIEKSWTTTIVTMELETLFNLEHIDPNYKFNSVRAKYAEQAEIQKENQEQVIKDFCQSVRAVFQRELETEIMNAINRINGDE